MKRRKWTDDDLRIAVTTSLSVAQVLRKLNLAIAGGSYTYIQKHIKRLDLDTSHWSGQSNKGRYGSNKNKTLKEILQPNSPYLSSNVRQHLLNANLKTNQCEHCGITEWRGNPLTIQLHHINGIRNDNRLDNLQMLCPNCHSQK